MSDYPEHDKQALVVEQSVTANPVDEDWLRWLQSRQILARDTVRDLVAAEDAVKRARKRVKQLQEDDCAIDGEMSAIDAIDAIATMDDAGLTLRHARRIAESYQAEVAGLLRTEGVEPRE